MLASAAPAPTDPMALRLSTRRWGRRRPKVLALPKRSDGWSAECRAIVDYAVYLALDNYAPGADLPAVVVPDLGDLLVAAGDLAYRSNLAPADVLVALRSAMLYVGIE